jgi:hypothetical protein
MVFCDGHVEYAKWKRWIDRTDKVMRRWNVDNQPHTDLLQSFSPVDDPQYDSPDYRENL